MGKKGRKHVLKNFLITRHMLHCCCLNNKFYMVRPPGFEPGSSAWQADVLTKLDYGRVSAKLQV